MIELRNNSLQVSFPEVHPMAKMTVTFEKAFRAEQEGQEASKLSTKARFPLKHIDDYAAKIPAKLLKRGGIILPMYQSEALAIHFMPHKAKSSDGSPYENAEGKSWYPFIVKVGCGLINAVSGGNIKDKLSSYPQNYLFIDKPTLLYGMNDKSGVIRQFIASPLGKGITVEEQLTGNAQYGGIQLIIYPLKKKTFEEFYAPQKKMLGEKILFSLEIPCLRLDDRIFSKKGYIPNESVANEKYKEECNWLNDHSGPKRIIPSMGISYGERICSLFEKDFYDHTDWDRKHYSRCFVHILNSEAWEEITGEKPETNAISEKQYRSFRLSWKEEYCETHY